MAKVTIHADKGVNDIEKEFIAKCWTYIKPKQKKDYVARYVKINRD